MKKYFTANGVKHYVDVRKELDWICFDEDLRVWGYSMKPVLILIMWVPSNVWGCVLVIDQPPYCKRQTPPYCKHWRKSLRGLYLDKG